ncbi:MAG TPA: hypothetical protein VGO47_14030 [Chlamydiales bacterium]|jgi:hypothetical protein|nr:hypothetical protein [Chlamydiales bacterium]
MAWATATLTGASTLFFGAFYLLYDVCFVTDLSHPVQPIIATTNSGIPYISKVNLSNVSETMLRQVCEEYFKALWSMSA